MRREAAGEATMAADILELYVRFRAKDATMTKKAWIELLDVTMPKLASRRDLLEIRTTTRLAYVMTLVGCKRDPSLASLAIAAMLVGHWCDPGPCAALQQDAIRHATVTSVPTDPLVPLDSESIAEHIEKGVRNALDGHGLERLGVIEKWDQQAHILFPGGASGMLKELDRLAHDCREAASDSDAREVLHRYKLQKGMDSFVKDFLSWGRQQLKNLPPTMFDKSLRRAVQEPSPSSPDVGCAGLSRSNGGGGTGGRGSGGKAGRSRGTRGDRSGGDGCGGSASRQDARQPSTRHEQSQSFEDDTGGHGGSNCKRNQAPVMLAAAAASTDGSAPPRVNETSPQQQPRRSPKSSTNRSSPDSGLGRGSRANQACVDASTERGDTRTLEDGSEKVPIPGSGLRSDEPRLDNRDHEVYPTGPRSGSRPSAKPRPGSESIRKLLDLDESSPFPDGDLSDSDSTYSSEASLKDPDKKEPNPRLMNLVTRKLTNVVGRKRDKKAARQVAENAKHHVGLRRAARMQGALVEGERVVHVTKVNGTPTKWVQGTVASNRKDGTYDVDLTSGEVVSVVPRADLYSCEGASLPPDGCPAAVFRLADVIANASSPTRASGDRKLAPDPPDSPSRRRAATRASSNACGSAQPKDDNRGRGRTKRSLAGYVSTDSEEEEEARAPPGRKGRAEATVVGTSSSLGSTSPSKGKSAGRGDATRARSGKGDERGKGKGPTTKAGGLGKGKGPTTKAGGLGKGGGAESTKMPPRACGSRPRKAPRVAVACGSSSSSSRSQRRRSRTGKNYQESGHDGENHCGARGRRCDAPSKSEIAAHVEVSGRRVVGSSSSGSGSSSTNDAVARRRLSMRRAVR